MASWNAVQKEAMKILGAGAKVPDVPSALAKTRTDWDKKGAEFKAAREACAAKLLAMDNANSALVNGFEQFRARIEKNDFELDPKKDLEKIDQARKILLEWIDESLKNGKTIDKTLGELNKHLIQVSKYEPS